MLIDTAPVLRSFAARPGATLAPSLRVCQRARHAAKLGAGSLTRPIVRLCRLPGQRGP